MTAIIEQTTAAPTESEPGREALPQRAAQAVTDEATAAATEAVKAAMHQTFTVGTLTIEAADEAEALRKYKRMVRAEALKAKVDQNWCDGGTNERLRTLGLREVGVGVPMRVNVTATRTAYLSIDAENADEAKALIAESGEDVLAMATASIGRQWTVTAIDPIEGELIDTTKTRSVGDPDDTVSGLAHQGEHPPGLINCETYHDGYYCTLPRGHVGPQHAAGNGRTIREVWDRRN